MESKKDANQTELLNRDENMHSVDMCIAASEALVIKQVIESGSVGYSSASAILEASLQVKQTRLEVWNGTFDGSTPVTTDIDNLSDLDDVTMESAYEDAGIHLDGFSRNELCVSQVKDTFSSDYDETVKQVKDTFSSDYDETVKQVKDTFSSDYDETVKQVKDTFSSDYDETVKQVNDTFSSDYDETVKHEKTVAAATIRGMSFNDRHAHMRVLSDERFSGDTPKRLISESVRGLGTDIGYQDHCLRIADTNAELHLSVSSEQGDNAITAENRLHEANVRSSPVMSCQDTAKDCSLPNNVEEQFKSRWFGCWTSNNELKYTTVKHHIPGPFACETSFLSESAGAPDENSFVQNHIKGAIIGSQLSVSSENFYNRTSADMLLSQDVRSSNTSLVDSLCSVVPCSISENICSSLALNYVNAVNPGNPNNAFECNIANAKETSPSASEPISNIKQSRNGVSRRFTSLKDCSKQLASHNHQKQSFFMESNIDLTFRKKWETTVKVGAEVLHKENKHGIDHLSNQKTQSHFWASNSSIDNEENPIRPSLLESKSQCPNVEKLQSTLIQHNTHCAQKLLSAKRVRFCESEMKISDMKIQSKVQAASNNYLSTRASRKSTNINPHIDSVALRMDKVKKRLIFQNMEFLLTGFSQKKEKEIEGLIRKYGGIVLSQVPSTKSKEKRSSRLKSRALPIVLCLKKQIQSFKFLYGCAVNAYVLKVNWLTDSIASGFVLPPKKYIILPRNINRVQDQFYADVNYDTHPVVFNNLGVMLHGKTKYFTNIATIIKHGGGQVFKTLPRLVEALEAGRISIGIVVVHEDSCASRHLKHFALEKNIPITPVQLIIKSLYAGQLIFLEEKNNSGSLPAIKHQRRQDLMELSQEI